MRFPLEKYTEKPSHRRNTLQIFITNCCNLHCQGCFARHVMGNRDKHMSIEEYKQVLESFKEKGGEQINLIGGEPLLHPDLKEMIKLNKKNKIKTTIYTNGYFLRKYTKEDFDGVKIRVSIYNTAGAHKSLEIFQDTNIPLDFCFMVGAKTTVEEMLESAKIIEERFDCNVFFISSLRELDNPEKDFFVDTKVTMPVIEYKNLVHDFMHKYTGNMEIHISKRGVFESTTVLTGNKCKFANYFIGGKIIQCPYDIVNQKDQADYEFDCRNCQHNNSCLMSKVVYIKKR